MGHSYHFYLRGPARNVTEEDTTMLPLDRFFDYPERRRASKNEFDEFGWDEVDEDDEEENLEYHDYFPDVSNAPDN